MAKDYAQKRKQFGQPISSFQGVSFKLADMALKIENARNTLYNACWLKDNGHPFGKQSAMAKLYCSEIAKEVTDEAVQIFGGSRVNARKPRGTVLPRPKIAANWGRHQLKYYEWSFPEKY